MRSARRRARYGDEQFQLWRRSYDVAPPPVEPGSQWDVSRDARYASLPPEMVPATESLADVVARLLPYRYDEVVPDLRARRTVLLSAHSNSLRALVAHLDALSPQEVLGLNIPTGMPLVYDLDGDMAPVARGGRHLDPVAATRAAAAVAPKGADSPSAALPAVRSACWVCSGRARLSRAVGLSTSPQRSDRPSMRG